MTLQYQAISETRTLTQIPPSFNGGPITEYQEAGKTTCTNANQLYTLTVSNTVLDGTVNKVGVLELNIKQNDWTSATAANSDAEITIYRVASSVPDGTAVGTLTPIMKFRMIAEARINLMADPIYDIKAIRIASTVAGLTFNWDMRVGYFNPSS